MIKIDMGPGLGITLGKGPLVRTGSGGNIHTLCDGPQARLGGQAPVY